MSLTAGQWIRRYASVVAAALYLAAAASAFGQGTNASIIGQVTDESGAVLPGVTITASGPALQVGSLAAVSDEQGEYRIAPLPIGTYTVVYELQGFQAVRREEVRLTVGFIAKLDVALSIGGVAETITVAGTAPVVDVTSTAPASQFTKETLDLIPTSRNGLLGLMAQAPGVRGTSEAGGSISFSPPNIRVFGQVGESWNLLEGIMTTAAQGTGGFGNYWDYAAMEEASVQTIGSDAEVPIRGATINGIVKSGGNAFHGSGFLGYMDSNLQSSNISSELAAQGITTGAKILERYDVSADLGGRITRDKLWFYAATRKRFNEQEALGAVRDDGSPASNVSGQTFFTGKLSYQATPGNKLIGFWQRVNRPSTTTNQFTDWESRSNTPVLTYVWKGEWQTVRRNNIVASAQWGFWGYTDGPRISFTNAVPRMDRFTSRVSGANLSQGETIDYHRWHPKATLTWYKPDWVGGNHEFKTGFDYMPNFGTRGNITRESPNYRLIFNNGAPLQIQTFNNPTDPAQHINYLGLYGQDSWTIKRRFTLNVGLRFGREDAFVPQACRRDADAPAQGVFPAACFDRVGFRVLSNVAPRVRASYDLRGNGRTALKGGWGRYYRIRQVAPDIEQADPQQKSTASFRWRDLNGNRDYDAGEVNWDVNGSDFVSLTGGSNQVPNPDERTPRTDEFSLTVEHQIRSMLALRGTGVHSRVRDVYRLANLKRPASVYTNAIVRPDPGNDGLVGTSDDPGTSITYYEYPASLSGRAFEQFMVINDPAANQEYTSLEFAITRRLDRRWQFTGSISGTKTTNPLVGDNTEFGLTHIGAAVDPNSEIFAANRTWDWLTRLSGAYILPAAVTLSANFESRSGQPLARTVLFTGGVLSSLTVRVEPIGSRRLPVTNTLDLRAEKAFVLPGGHRLQARVNLYNALNVNTVTGMTVQSGPNFLRPSAIMSPRIAEFSASYSF